jgi:hypothetical protein
MNEEFFVGKATEHLIGKGILPKHLNDDRLGRALDKYYQTGTTKIFTANKYLSSQFLELSNNSKKVTLNPEKLGGKIFDCS